MEQATGQLLEVRRTDNRINPTGSDVDAEPVSHLRGTKAAAAQ